ncbi:MAG: GspE/PulE family protein [Patescibacteria group bacterium]|nr:GspE/PulE family protein [Patescibacteria group bacterium]
MADQDQLNLNDYFIKLKKTEAEELAQALAQSLGLKYFDLELRKPAPDILRLIPEADSRELKIAPIKKEAGVLIVGVYNPDDLKVKNYLEKLKQAGYRLEVGIISLNSLESVWPVYHFSQSKSVKYLETLEISPEKLLAAIEGVKTIAEIKSKIETSTESNPFDILDYVLAGAFIFGASDIHFEPEEDRVNLKFRIDGILYQVAEIPLKVYRLIKNRIKLAAGMFLDVSDRAQDGRFAINLKDDLLDVRVSVVPGIHAETIVMRILNVKSVLLNLNELGFRPDDLELVKTTIKLPNGLILNTGPTGSGKTTTLYSILNMLKRPEIKIVTIEDPVEYQLEGISQTQVNVREGYTFANGLRSALRQDPDVILVGEVRDHDTAETAIQAALTGHLVLSTLHTNNSLGAMPRLIELGVDKTLIPPSLRLIVAQRLVRKVCPRCRQEYRPDQKIVERIKLSLADLGPVVKSSLDLEKIKLVKAVGCDYCLKTGYKGRIGVFEFIKITPAVEKIIYGEMTEADLLAQIKKEGFVSLQQDAIIKILLGVTTIDEVERVTGPIVSN